MSESGHSRQDRIFAEGKPWRDARRSACESESVLDIYNLLLAMVLFASPWFFAHASRTAGIDLWLSSAAIIILSLAAIVAYSTWEEWINLALGLWLVVSALFARLCPHAGDAFQHRNWFGDRVLRRA